MPPRDLVVRFEERRAFYVLTNPTVKTARSIGDLVDLLAREHQRHAQLTYRQAFEAVMKDSELKALYTA